MRKKGDFNSVLESLRSQIKLIDGLKIGSGCKVMAIQRVRDCIEWIERGKKEE